MKNVFQSELIFGICIAIAVTFTMASDRPYSHHLVKREVSSTRLNINDGSDISRNTQEFRKSDVIPLRNFQQIPGDKLPDLFSARHSHQLVRFNNGTGNRLWLIGGIDGVFKNDVWSSQDGKSWKLETLSAEFSPRHKHQVISFNPGNGNRLWLIGGYDGQHKNDVWSSVDGVNWVEETDNAGFSPRVSHQVITFDDGKGIQLWLIGGLNSSRLNDIWSTHDGINWILKNGNASFSKRYDHKIQTLSKNNTNTLWLIGGNDGEIRRDIWSSVDGVNWILENNNPAFAPRTRFELIKFDRGSGDLLWLIGGTTGRIRKNDVWASSDGIKWDLVIDSASFPARYSHSVSVFEDGDSSAIWLIGGAGPATRYLSDIWFSTDGRNWVQTNTAKLSLYP